MREKVQRFFYTLDCLFDRRGGRSIECEGGMQSRSTLIRVRSLISVSAVPVQWKIPIDLRYIYTCRSRSTALRSTAPLHYDFVQIAFLLDLLAAAAAFVLPCLL